MHVASMLTPDGIAIFIDGESLTVNRTHPNFNEVLRALREKRYTDLPNLMDVPRAMSGWLGDRDGFTMADGIISLDGEPFGEAVSEKVLRMMRDGFQPEPLLNFLRKVRENPSFSAQQELLLFWSANNGLIHEDGDILAYKAVNDDYTDVHSGTIRNMVGDIPTMPRHQVDDCRENTCSRGLHFAAHAYAAKNFTVGPRVMVLKLNPRDVVSIPSDYENQKGRCCRYEVIAELPNREVQLPAKEVLNDGDVASVGIDQSVRARIVRVLDRLTSGRTGLITRETRIKDLGLVPKDVEQAVEAEFGITIGVLYDYTTLDEIVEEVEAELLEEDDVEDDLNLDDEDDLDEDLDEATEDAQDREQALDALFEDLQQGIIERKIESTRQFREAIERNAFDPEDKDVIEAAARHSLSQWL